MQNHKSKPWHCLCQTVRVLHPYNLSNVIVIKSCKWSSYTRAQLGRKICFLLWCWKCHHMVVQDGPHGIDRVNMPLCWFSNWCWCCTSRAKWVGYSLYSTKATSWSSPLDSIQTLQFLSSYNLWKIGRHLMIEQQCSAKCVDRETHTDCETTYHSH